MYPVPGSMDGQKHRALGQQSFQYRRANIVASDTASDTATSDTEMDAFTCH